MPRKTDFDKVHKLMQYYYQRKGQAVTISEIPYNLIGISQMSAYNYSYRLVDLDYLQYSQEAGRFRWNVEMPFPDVWQVSERWETLTKDFENNYTPSQRQAKHKKAQTSDGKVKYLKPANKQTEQPKELDYEILNPVIEVVGDGSRITPRINNLRDFLIRPIMFINEGSQEKFDKWQENERENYIRLLEALIQLAGVENISEVKKDDIGA